MTRWISTKERVKGRGSPPLSTWNQVFRACWGELISKLDEIHAKYDKDIVVEQLNGNFRRYGGGWIAERKRG